MAIERASNQAFIGYGVHSRESNRGVVSIPFKAGESGDECIPVSGADATAVSDGTGPSA